MQSVQRKEKQQNKEQIIVEYPPQKRTHLLLQLYKQIPLYIGSLERAYLGLLTKQNLQN